MKETGNEEFNPEQQFYLNYTRLKNVNNHPYLEIEVSCDLKWRKHIKF